MTKNKGQKNIPDEWEIKKLGEVGDAFIGLTYSPKNVSKEGTLVFRSSNIQNGKIDYSNNVFVDIENISEKNIVKKGDILICARNGSKRLIGKNILISEKEEGNAFGAFMSVYRTKNYEYFYQLFQSQFFRKEIERDLGPTINQVTTGNLLKFKFTIPPFPEQKRIVKVLEVWDCAVELLERKIVVKENIKKGLLQSMMNCELSIVNGKEGWYPKLRLPGFSGEWEDVRLGDVCEVKKSNVSANSLELNVGDYDIFGASGFIKKINFYTQDTSYIAIVKDGAGVGRLTLYKEKTSVLGTLNVLVPKDGNKLLFLYPLLQMVHFQKYVVGSTIPHIYFKDYKIEKIKIPKKKEQKAIAEILTTTDEEIEALRKKLDILKDQKKFLLNNLVTGIIRVPE